MVTRELETIDRIQTEVRKLKLLYEKAKQMEDFLIPFRRNLHSYPELSFEERETSGKVLLELEKLGLSIQKEVGGYGIVADLEGENEGQTIALRADMDALPIEEETGLSFASKRKGVMHACGHDAHTTILLGTARLLADYKSQLKGKVRFLFQSAEEINAGAKQMIDQGALDGVDEIYGLHNLPTLSAGKFATRYGPLMGSVDRIEIFIEGKGGHGAIPDQSIDPVVCASAIVMGLQTAVSREISPFDPAVVTIGSLKAGDANNVIPHRAELTGTIRTFSPEVQVKMEERLRRIIEEIASAYRCKAELKYIEQTPVLVNHDLAVKHVEDTLVQQFAQPALVEAAPTMAGEDFSIYLNHVPGCFFWLGSGPEKGAEDRFGLHHPQFDINESCLAYGVSAMAEIALARLQ